MTARLENLTHADIPANLLMQLVITLEVEGQDPAKITTELFALEDDTDATGEIVTLSALIARAAAVTGITFDGIEETHGARLQ